MCGAGWRYPPLSTSPLTGVTARGVQESRWGLTCEFRWNPRLPFQSGVAEFSDSGVTVRCPCTAWSDVWALHCAADLRTWVTGDAGSWHRHPSTKDAVGCGVASTLTSESCARVQTSLRSCSTAGQTFKQRWNIKEHADSPNYAGCVHLHTLTHTHREVNRTRQEGKLKRPN